MDNEDRAKLTFGSLAGEDGFEFGPGKKNSGKMVASHVNPYLWRSTLDTLSFMPLSSADSVGGIIISDWYTSPSKPHEKIKLTILIKDIQLRADALKIIANKQLYKNNGWSSAYSDEQLALKLENIILSRARDLRILSEKK